MADIRKRKKELKDDLELLENDFENRISSVQKIVEDTLDPVSIIKRNPLKTVGASVLIGLAIGLMGEDKPVKNGEEVVPGEPGEGNKEKLFDLLFNEIKRVAARKAGTYFSEFIDQRMSKGD